MWAYQDDVFDRAFALKKNEAEMDPDEWEEMRADVYEELLICQQNVVKMRRAQIASGRGRLNVGSDIRIASSAQPQGVGYEVPALPLSRTGATVQML